MNNQNSICNKCLAWHLDQSQKFIERNHNSVEKWYDKNGLKLKNLFVEDQMNKKVCSSILHVKLGKT